MTTSLPDAASTVGVGDARTPLVLALDVGSTATRGGVYDATGRPVAGATRKIRHQFTTSADGASEIDPDQVVDELAQLIDALSVAVPVPVAGVALDTFASSLVGVGADGRAVTPCYTYADSRSATQVHLLRREFDEAAAQQLSGCRFHSSYLPARLRWLRETRPEVFGASRRWMSVGEYAWSRLIAVTAVGTSTAAWTGLLDRHATRWSGELLRAAGVDEAQLSEIRDPSDPLQRTGGAAPDRPTLSDAVWFAPVTDGFASNLGAGAHRTGTAGFSAATSGFVRVLVDGTPERAPAGLWCYRVDAARSLLGGAVNDVGRMTAWLDTTVHLDGVDPAAILAAPPDHLVPSALPFVTGERSTGWAASARAAFVGVSAATSGPQLYRAALEAVALSYRRIVAELRTVTDVDRAVVSGRVVQDLPGLVDLLADATDVPLARATLRRATLRGTALHALDVLSPGTERAPVPTADPAVPRPEHRDHYAHRAQVFERLHAAFDTVQSEHPRRSPDG